MSGASVDDYAVIMNDIAILDEQRAKRRLSWAGRCHAEESESRADDTAGAARIPLVGRGTGIAHDYARHVARIHAQRSRPGELRAAFFWLRHYAASRRDDGRQMRARP